MDPVAPPLHPQVGMNIADPDARGSWRAFVAALDHAARPGGPLEGYLFHGTDADVAALVAYEGVTTTFAIAGQDGCAAFHETEGTHWGTPKVAAFYAEDLIERHDDPGLELAILAVRVADLEGCGRFATDGQTIDCPLHTRLDRDPAATDAAWDASAKDWRACLDVLGTLLVLGPVPSGDVRALHGLSDLDLFLSELDSTADFAPNP